MVKDEFNKLSAVIFDSAVEVHKRMGPGLLEAVYHSCMLNELQIRKISCKSEVAVPLKYKDQDLNKNYIIDILVENEIILELKTVEAILPIHEALIISYLKLADKRLGFLINFNEPLLKLGFRRFVNGF
ncbi:MAG TPA: GxxExxY protein [Cyclobacteriaceae bacterium]|nr:GxxExxY protein [Cyclobacteriaceae bacterium]